MFKFILIGLAIYGFLLATFFFLEILSVIVSGIHYAIARLVLNHQKIIEKINQIGIGQEQKFNIIRGRYFYDLDIAFSSALEYIESDEKRLNFVERRRKIFEEMNKEIGGQN